MPTVTVERLSTADPARYPNQDKVPTTVKAQLFGKLVERVAPHLRHFHSDLYHDAQWIEELEEAAHHPHGDTYWFYYAANDCGTAIGTDKALVYYYREAVQLNVTLSREDNGWWQVIIIDDTER